MSSTICLKTNQNRLIASLRHAFTQASMLGELMQNARRAQASCIHITVDGDTLTLSDDGAGITDLQTLIFVAESGWDDELKARENAFGLGMLSTLYFARDLSVHSLDRAFHASTVSIIRGDEIEVVTTSPRVGTEIRLEGVQSLQPNLSLTEWVGHELQRLCKVFPVPVLFNGVEVEGLLADPFLQWRDTAMGRVLIDLHASRLQWRCFLQGLPIGNVADAAHYQVVLLPDDTPARLPDRQYLLNRDEDYRRIQAAVDEAFREALIEKKRHLAESDFVSRYAQICLDSLNADLLNDIRFFPLAWFRDWKMEPAGFSRYWQHYSAAGLVAREAVEAVGVWQIETDGYDAPTAEVYLEKLNAFLLTEPCLDDGHWLKTILRTIKPAQIQVEAGVILHKSADADLAEYVELDLVDTLRIGLEGEPAVEVTAIRKDDILYITPDADSVTPLLSNYIFDDCYDENREEEDARVIQTFIAVGCSHSPDGVLAALLPDRLRYSVQPRLANATVCLTFDGEGKLVEVR